MFNLITKIKGRGKKIKNKCSMKVKIPEIEYEKILYCNNSAISLISTENQRLDTTMRSMLSDRKYYDGDYWENSF